MAMEICPKSPIQQGHVYEITITGADQAEQQEAERMAEFCISQMQRPVK